MKLPVKLIEHAFVIICLLGAVYVGVTIANAEQYLNDQVTDSIKLGLIIILCIVGYVSGRAFFQFTHTTPIFLLAMMFLIVLHLTELTEEFAVFGPVPLFGEVTVVKRAFETILMIGSICLLLGAIYHSIFEINKAREQLVSQVRFLEVTACIDRIVRQADNQEHMVRDILEMVMSAFNCDRAFVLHPCDPKSETCQISIECARAKESDGLPPYAELSITTELSEAFRSLLASDGPLAMTWPAGACEWDPDGRFDVRSQLVMAVHLNRDRPWAFGIQQYTHTRVWTEQEQRLFDAIGRRMTEDLNHHQLNHHLRESEARYRSLFDHANDAIFLMDSDRFIECNNKTLEMYGSTREQIIGRTQYDPFSPESQPDGRNSREKAWEKIRLAQAGQPQFFEWSHLKQNGTPFEAGISLSPIELSGKTYIQAIVRDITERKRAEEKMRKSSIIIESTSDAVITTDIAGNITFWNKGAEIIYGYRKEEAIGRPVRMIYKEEDVHILETMIEDLMKGNDIPAIEVTCIDKNRRDIEILLSLTTLKDADGNITELVGITKDITEQKKNRIALQESQQRLQNLIEHMPIVCFTFGRDGRILTWNRAAERIYGYTEEEAVGANAYDLIVTAATKDATDQVIKDVFDGKTVEGSEWQDRHKNGTLGWRMGNTFPLFNTDGSVY